MYGTVARLRAKPGRAGDLRALMEEWDRDMKPRVPGAERSLVYRLDADEDAFIVAAAFRDRKSYLANADNPDQDKWYRRLRECLDSDPEWMDGEIVHAS